ncbi:MAG: TlpA disulfide reductase family protein [Thiohalophilus sp.]
MRQQPLIYRFLPWLMLLLALPVYAQPSALPEGIIQLDPYPAPVLSLNDLDGEPYSLENQHGSVVFVHFWASWCGPCRKEMPAIQRMWDKLQDEGLEIALVNTAENEDTVFSFLAIHAPNIRPLMDHDGQMTEQWKPRGLPATYLVNRNGQVIYQAIGGRPWDEPTYLAFLRKLIAHQEP